MIRQIPTQMIPELWPALLPFLERACRHHPLESPANLLQKCLNGKAAMCIESDDGTILTVFVLEAHEYPDKTACLVAALSGRPGFMSRLPAISAWVDEWARLHGCTGVAIMGRPGWARVFDKPGVEQVRLVVAYRSLPHVHAHPGNHGDDPSADRADGGMGGPAKPPGATPVSPPLPTGPIKPAPAPAPVYRPMQMPANGTMPNLRAQMMQAVLPTLNDPNFGVPMPVAPPTGGLGGTRTGLPTFPFGQGLY